MMVAKKMKFMTDPMGILRAIDRATHEEVMYHIPYAEAWAAREDDNTLVDMESLCIAMILSMANQMMFAPPRASKPQ